MGIMISQLIWLQFMLAGTVNAVNRALLQPDVDPQCRQEVDYCEAMNVTKCLGATLSYQSSSFVLANDSDTEFEVIEKLHLWSGLRNVPKCWEVIQPFLCSVYLPKCETHENSSYVILPGRELCEQIRKPCKVVETYSGWPHFLQCDQPHFPSGCSESNPIKRIQFNTTSTCELPLVATDNQNSWYEDIDGCGIQCNNPLFTEEEHTEIHTFIAVFGSLCMACTLFAVLSFLIDWKNASRYPALILFFINACFFIGSVGWMAQFIPGARKDIVCRSDGTMRSAEPQLGSGETASCTVVFVLVYYFMMAGVTWFVILAYAWNLTFKALGYPRDVIEGKRGHFHLVAWSFPLVLTIVCLALTQIDGDSVSGICFVGYLNHTYRGFFVLLPIGLVIVIGFGFLTSGLVTLVKMKLENPGLISDKASAKIRETIIRLGIFASFALLFVIVTFVVHVYIFTNEPLWKKSFDDYIICEANVTVAKSLNNRTTRCVIKDRPNLVAMEIHMFAYFGAGIVMSSWVWNKSTLITWRRFIKKRCFNQPEEKPPVKLRKHEIIAQAFSKRGEMNDGQISLSFYSAHDDPIGMKFDVNSISSMEMSSAWAAAIPRLISRRGGMAHPNSRRHSDSDVQSLQSTSFGPVSGILIESHSPRRNSLQSHGSQTHSDQDHECRHHRKKKKRRHRRGANRVTPASSVTATPPVGGLKAGSSQCTSAVSSSAEPPIIPKMVEVEAEVVAMDDEDDEGDKAEFKEEHSVADSDSIRSEDSNYTIPAEIEMIDEKAGQTISTDEGLDEVRLTAGEDPEEQCHIPSEKSAFKTYKQEFAQPAVQAHHHHHTSSYSMVTSLGYMPPTHLPEYPPDYMAMPPYSINNYPMTFMPQDYYMPPPGYMPPQYYGNPMSPPYPPGFHMPPPPAHMVSPNSQHPHRMPNPGSHPFMNGMTPPGFNPMNSHGSNHMMNTSYPHMMSPMPGMYPPYYPPYDNMGYLQKVEPLRYVRNQHQGPTNSAESAPENNEPVSGQPPKPPRKSDEVPSRTKNLRKMTEEDFPSRSKRLEKLNEKELPSKSRSFQRSSRHSLPSRVRHHSDSDRPTWLPDDAKVLAFEENSRERSAKAVLIGLCDHPRTASVPSVSSTYHLDRVELEDCSDTSV